MTKPLSRLRRGLVEAYERRAFPGIPPRTHQVVVRPDLPVTMSDGVRLRGDLHMPVDHAPAAPTVLIRSPYGRSGPVATHAAALATRGFPVFIQSCRGTSGSEGTFVPQLDEQRDGVDTIRWLRARPWFTGRLVTLGQSYLGYVQWAVAGHLERTEPDLAPDALCLFVTMPDFGAVTWDNGAFSLRNALGWSAMMTRMDRPLGLLRAALPNPRLGRAFDRLPLAAGDVAATGTTVPWYQDWLTHESLDDEYWTAQSHTDSVADVTAPVLMVTGWYDLFLPWQLDTYRRLATAGNPPRLTVGPWAHSARDLGDACLAESLDLLGEEFLGQPSTRTAPVRIFVTGADEWRDLDAWPPPTDQVDHLLQPGGGLGTGPAPDGPPSTYRYDPDRPTPTVGGPTVTGSGLPEDNRKLEARDDVLTFTGAVLDQPVEVIGEPTATIHIRSDRPSFDVFVRLCDVGPDGASMTVCDGIRRIGSVGTTKSDPVPDDDGVVAVEVPLWPLAHRFGAGHRIRVLVSSGAHPRYARNPGSAQPAASAVLTHVADQEIFHDPAHHSGIRLGLNPVVD